MKFLKSQESKTSFKEIPSKPKPEDFFERLVGYAKKFMTIKATLAVLGIAYTGGTLIYVVGLAQADENKIKAKFTNPITVTQKVKDYVQRKEVESDLKQILTPDEDVKGFFVISGEHGTGKTTIVQKVCEEIGHGIIYVDVPEEVEEFSYAFSQAIGINYHQENNGFFSYIYQKVFDSEKCIIDLNVALDWMIVYRKFKLYADWYRKKHGKAPVLVVDNINRLAKKAPEVLETLQEGAKDAVGSGLFKAVFVTSDGSAPTQMQGFFS